MIKLYPRIHNTANHFKKKFLWISFLLLAILYTGIHPNAQCPVVNVTPATSCGGVVSGGPYDNRGEKIITRTFTQTIPYQKIDVDVRAHGKGLYWIELRDASGKRLAMNRAVVQ